jgi:Tfp pilus assembly protein PilP
MRIAIILTGFMILAIAGMPAEDAVAAEQKKINDTTKEATKETAAPAPETGKKNDYYEYTSVGRRDPFTSLIQKKTSDKEKGATALESYESADMKLIAVLWEKNRYYAVVSLPDGKSYTVFEGVKVGKSSGIIKKINKDTMIIAERVKDARGRISPKERVLKLRTEEE